MSQNNNLPRRVAAPPKRGVRRTVATSTAPTPQGVDTKPTHLVSGTGRHFAVADIIKIYSRVAATVTPAEWVDDQLDEFNIYFADRHLEHVYLLDMCNARQMDGGPLGLRHEQSLLRPTHYRTLACLELGLPPAGPRTPAEEDRLNNALDSKIFPVYNYALLPLPNNGRQVLIDLLTRRSDRS